MRWDKPKERIVATIGYQGHGKTVFLASLFWDSYFPLAKAFSDGETRYSVHAINEEADKLFFGNAFMLNALELPPSNPRRMPAPAVLEFNGVPSVTRLWRRNRRRDIKLTFYDMAGEDAKDDEWLRTNAPFLPKADDIIFLFDPTHENFNNAVIEAGRLRDRIGRVAPQCKHKHWIVALTKIDEPKNESHTQTEWGTEIPSRPDDSSSPKNLPEYLREMEARSNRDEWRRWWNNRSGVTTADGFLNGLPRNTHYCALSSLGHQPVWDCLHCEAMGQPSMLQQCGNCGGERRGAKLRLCRKPEPIRVRDPLFWIFREAGVM
jgi:hypothetical protein